jgi:hypothetical protein
MAAMWRKEGGGIWLASGSVILIGSAALLIGVAGFGIGYRVEQSRTKSAINAARAKPNAKANNAAKTAQLKLQKFRIYLAGQGLHWPVIAGKFATQMRAPPPGVDHAKYRKALTACYIAAVNGSRAPPTTTGA